MRVSTSGAKPGTNLRSTPRDDSELKKAMAGRPRVGGFPYPAETLRRAGVTRNIWFLPACQTLYLTNDGPVVTLAPRWSLISPMFHDSTERR